MTRTLTSLRTILTLADVPDDYVETARRAGMTDREIAERLSAFSGLPMADVLEAVTA